MGASRTRRAAAVGLVLVVVVAHGCVADQMAVRMSDMSAAAQAPKRMDVSFVRDMEQSAPPAAPPVPPAARRPRPLPRAVREPSPEVAQAAEPAASAASAPEVAEAASAPEVVSAVPAPVVVEPPPTVAGAASAAASQLTSSINPPGVDDVASGVAPAMAAASAAEGFAWPASTRLTYALVGNYRGEISGTASVEWVHIGDRYQVHLDLSVAPLLSRRMSSEGRLTADGLFPERFDQDSKVAFRARQLTTLRLDADAISFPDGSRVPRPVGLQDSTSQFVQLTYLFTMRPDLLVAGRSVEVPLALPRRVDHWIYDVQGAETLSTVIGNIDTFYLKPRRAVPKPGDLAAEIWIAPTLHYLPVRIRIRQDEWTYLDLTLDRKPQLAAQ